MSSSSTCLLRSECSRAWAGWHLGTPAEGRRRGGEGRGRGGEERGRGGEGRGGEGRGGEGRGGEERGRGGAFKRKGKLVFSVHSSPKCHSHVTVM